MSCYKLMMILGSSQQLITVLLLNPSTKEFSYRPAERVLDTNHLLPPERYFTILTINKTTIPSSSSERTHQGGKCFYLLLFKKGEPSQKHKTSEDERYSYEWEYLVSLDFATCKKKVNDIMQLISKLIFIGC